jgi:hypothetical protein
LILCIDEIGAFLVLVPAVGWLFWSGDTGWAVVLLVWSVPVLTLYNILRPVLIRKGADLSLLLIFAGRPPHRPRRVRCPRATRPPVRIGWSVVRKCPGRRWLPR